MRLDRLLVIRGYFSTRQKAKEAIKRGFVRVDGCIVRKPSADVNPDSRIDVLTDERPKGYWKLKEIDERWGIIGKDDIVLDLGSSAGGFLLYASERAKFVYGIEISREFERDLRKIEEMMGNVRVFFEDVFKFDLSKLESVDVILNDLTLDPRISLKAIFRFLPVLKIDGRVLFVMKTGFYSGDLDFECLRVLKVMDSEDRRERFYLLVKDSEC